MVLAPSGDSSLSSRAGYINQWSRSRFSWFQTNACQPACGDGSPTSRPADASEKRPTPQFILLFKSPDDRSPQAPLRPGRIFLENQDLGGDVERRMGKPVRWLRALLPGKARG